MSDPTNKAQQALDRLTEKLVEEVFLASDAEILAEAKEEGRDVAGDAGAEPRYLRQGRGSSG